MSAEQRRAELWTHIDEEMRSRASHSDWALVLEGYHNWLDEIDKALADPVMSADADQRALRHLATKIKQRIPAVKQRANNRTDSSRPRPGQVPKPLIARTKK